MPGIVGGVTNKGESCEGIIGAMANVMRHRSSYGLHAQHYESYAVALIDHKENYCASNAVSADSRFFLSFYGSIYESFVCDPMGLAKQLLERWLQNGSAALCDLNGEYLVVIWDCLESRLTIVNDRLGLKRLAYWQSGEKFVFASEVKALAVWPDIKRKIDAQGMADLLILGHMQGDHTLLQDVKLLPPASVLTWHCGTVHIKEYWDYAFCEDGSLKNLDQIVDRYEAILGKACLRRLVGINHLGILLSGGLDSRVVGGFVRKVRPDIEMLSWTTGHNHDHDTRFAKDIARLLDSKHESISIPETFLEDYGPEYSWVLDGMVSTHGSHRTCVFPHVKNKANVLLIGYLGDRLNGGTPLNKVAGITNLDQLIEKAYSIYAVGFDDALLRQTLKPDIYNCIRDYGKDFFADEIRRAETESFEDRVMWWDLRNRQRLWNPLALMDLLGVESYVITPFADKDLINFMLHLPLKWRLNKEVYLHLIKRKLPKLAHINRSGDALPIIHSRIRASLHWRKVLFVRNVLPKLTGGRFKGHDYGAFVHCADWFRSGSRTFIEKTLIGNPLLEEHFQMDGLRHLVQGFLNNTSQRDLMDSIAALMSFALFREKLNTLPVFREGKTVICAES